MAVSGATALVGALVTDGWAALKSRAAALMRRGGGQEGDEALLRELEELRARLPRPSAAVTASTAETERRLRDRLLRLLADEPSVAGELRALIGQTQETVINHGTMVVTEQAHVSSSVVHHNYFAAPAAVPVPVLPRIVAPPVRHYENNERLLQRMDETWAACRAARVQALMYVVGVPGIGRTALTHRWLDRRRDELTGPQLHASLARDVWGNPAAPMAVLERWFRELGVPAQDVPADPDSRTAYFRTLTANGPVVVLLDDVVLASQVIPLLPGSPDSAVLMTSNIILPGVIGGLDAELLRMEPLEHPHGRRLLAKVGRMGDDTAEYAAYATELGQIADACQGHPLALRVAGAQLAVGHPGRIQELARELTDRATRLRALDMDDELSVTVVFAPAYRGLAPEAAHLYRCLGLHPTADFDMDVVRAVAPGGEAGAGGAADVDAEGGALRALRALVLANLVEQTGPGTYRMPHALIHDHALACARSDMAEEDREAALDRLLQSYVDIAERADTALSSRYRHDPTGAYAAHAAARAAARVSASVEDMEDMEDRAAVLAGLERRRDALRYAVRLACDTGRYEMAWRLAQALWTFYLRCGYHTDWIETYTWACDAAQECGDLTALARMRYGLGFAHLDRWSAAEGDPRAARERFEQALDLVRPRNGPAAEGQRRTTEGQRRTESSVLEGLGLMENRLGNAEQALENLTAALRALDGIDHPRGRALLAFHRGPVLTSLARHDEAAAELLSARAQFAALPEPDRYNEARALARYAEARQAAGQPAEALRAFDEASRLMSEHGPAYQQAVILLLRGDLLYGEGDGDRAAVDWSAAVDLFRQARSPRAEEAEGRLTGLRAPGQGD
ncbi:NB-ARC domain-containing protein [Streptomyces sp. NPDC059743]|uniref:NB-ARC domain-containing protein n=1 Tax=Streptomyces sp. NPDC059743 TaxID=3346928 RepID=UPI003669B780